MRHFSHNKIIFFFCRRSCRAAPCNIFQIVFIHYVYTNLLLVLFAFLYEFRRRTSGNISPTHFISTLSIYISISVILLTSRISSNNEFNFQLKCVSCSTPYSYAHWKIENLNKETMENVAQNEERKKKTIKW